MGRTEDVRDGGGRRSKNAEGDAEADAAEPEAGENAEGCGPDGATRIGGSENAEGASAG